MSRRAITLLEVLFSIFIVSVGLMSLAALLILGKSTTSSANTVDRSAACGQAAMSEIEMRGLLGIVAGEPFTDADGDGAYDSGEVFLDTYSEAPQAATYNAPWVFPVVIDPLLLGHPTNNDSAAAVARASVFPFDPNGTAGYYGTPLRLPRITPWPSLRTAAPIPHYGLANRVFRWADDLVFTAAEGDERPQRVFSQGADGDWGVSGTDDDGNGTDDDASEAGWPGSDDTATPEGDYTWVATVTPSPAEHSEAIRRTFKLSIAVFRKRPLVIDPAAAIPAERMCLADIVGGGLGGGDVRLRIPNTLPREWIDVQPNRWVMLAGWVADPFGMTILGGTNRPVCNWYRITATERDVETHRQAAAVNADEHDLYVTLAGPDWIPADTQIDTSGDGSPDAPYDADGNSDFATLDCYLFDDCVNVVEKTVTLDQTSLWTH